MARTLNILLTVSLSLFALAPDVHGIAWSGGGWGTAQRIETDNAGSAYRPQIGFDANGNALAVWSQTNGTRSNIWANRYTAGQGWGTAQLIEDDNAGGAYDPRIAVNSNGNAIAVWEQTAGSQRYFLVNRYTPGQGWGTPQLVETGNAGAAYDPQIAIDAGGNAVLVWHQHDGTRSNIRANRYTAGQGWGVPQLIETDNADSASYPQIAIDANGNALAVWYQSDGTRYNIRANRYTAGTGWGTAALIETDNAGSALDPRIAIDAGGNAMAVWYQRDGIRTNIWANLYTAGWGWGTAQLIETNNTGGASNPQIAINADGNAMVVWHQSDGVRLNIWANLYTAGGGWGTAQRIESNNTGAAFYPQIAIDADGNALAVWPQSDGLRNNMWANRYTAGCGWGTAQLIETDNAGGAFSPQIAVNADGNAIAVWHQSDGTRLNIWANRYTPPQFVNPCTVAF